uniref:Uncharacterized protein n=1 Tax=Siphoviridae sp. ctOXk3 TaxID=2827861 RepID=A0A8S5SYL1_9CAUD|nr:MAG TPA: hypothetical protein [Siphoviridae sp. ctOXk3]
MKFRSLTFFHSDFFQYLCRRFSNQAVIPAPVFACVFAVATLTMVVNAVFRRST